MRNLTEEEVQVLSEEYNLADGHAYRSWNEAESAIIDGVANIFHKVDRRDRDKIETEYLECFFKLTGQTFRKDCFDFFMCFTASSALEAIANYLRLNKLSAALIEPCFDNLHDILIRHSVPLSVFSEEMLNAEPDKLSSYLSGITADAIFLVTPNNPTGVPLRKSNFTLIIEYCKLHKKILILDTTFRLYLPEEEIFDQYGMLADADIDCIVVEDTGKTWPTLEIKAPFFSVSRRLAAQMAHIYSDFLLHVSPVAVALLTDFLRLPPQDGLGHIKNIISINRKILQENTKGTFLTAVEADYMCVSWLKINKPIKAIELQKMLAAGNVHVLTGNQFFWSDQKRGDCFIRVALSRDTAMFREASSKLGEICKF